MKEKILKGAEDLFFKYGIKNITMDEVAKHLGVSKKTIYQYFKDKDEIVHFILINKIEADRVILSKTHNESENLVVEVFGIMKNIKDIIGNINPIIFHELHKFYPNTWKIYENFKNGFILENIERCLKKGQIDGLVRSDINIKLLARMRLENIDMGFHGNVFPINTFNIVEVQLAMTEHFLYGICTLKGHKLINKHKNIVEE